MTNLSNDAGAAQAPVSRRATAGRINATLVPEHRRMGFLPRVFGERRMLQGENAVYNWMRALCPEYTGGFWEFLELSNGGFYMRPARDQQMRISVRNNDFEGVVSPDAAGVLATLFALNHMVFSGAEDLTDAYCALREFGIEHAEHAAIMGAID